MVNLPGSSNESHKSIDFEAAKLKISRYWSYQERSHSEVEQKLHSFKLAYDQVNEILAWLIVEGYLNEERFAIAFAGGKFRIKNWGKIKIKQHLQQKKVSDYSIKTALDKLDKEEYNETIKKLISKKAEFSEAKNVYELRNKVARYVINKGYEPDEVWQLVKTIID